MMFPCGVTNTTIRNSKISTKITAAATINHVPLLLFAAADFALRFIPAPNP